MSGTTRGLRPWIARAERISLQQVDVPSGLDLLVHITCHLFDKRTPTPKCLLGISGFCALLPSAAGLHLADVLTSNLAHAHLQRRPESQERNTTADEVPGDFALRRSLSTTFTEWSPDTSMPSPRLV